MQMTQCPQALPLGKLRPCVGPISKLSTHYCSMTSKLLSQSWCNNGQLVRCAPVCAIAISWTRCRLKPVLSDSSVTSGGIVSIASGCVPKHMSSRSARMARPMRSASAPCCRILERRLIKANEHNAALERQPDGTPMLCSNSLTTPASVLNTPMAGRASHGSAADTSSSCAVFASIRVSFAYACSKMHVSHLSGIVHVLLGGCLTYVVAMCVRWCPQPRVVELHTGIGPRVQQAAGNKVYTYCVGCIASHRK